MADETLADAMTTVRMNALVALGEVDPTDIKQITRLQAIAGCLQEVRDLLQAAVLNVQPNGFNPNERPE